MFVRCSNKFSTTTNQSSILATVPFFFHLPTELVSRESRVMKWHAVTEEIRRSKRVMPISDRRDQTATEASSLAVKFSHGRTFQLGTFEFLLDVVVYVSTITFRVRSIEILSRAWKPEGLAVTVVERLKRRCRLPLDFAFCEFSS